MFDLVQNGLRALVELISRSGKATPEVVNLCFGVLILVLFLSVELSRLLCCIWRALSPLPYVWLCARITRGPDRQKILRLLARRGGVGPPQPVSPAVAITILAVYGLMSLLIVLELR
jgi:hypothetical protein